MVKQLSAATRLDFTNCPFRTKRKQSPPSCEPHICRPETIGDRDSRSASYHVMPRRLDGVNCAPHAFICAKTHTGACGLEMVVRRFAALTGLLSAESVPAA